MQKIVITLLVLAFHISLTAQEPRLVIQKGHGRVFQATGVKFSEDGKYLVSSGDNIVLWDTYTGRQLFTFKGNSPALLSPDNAYIACGASDEKGLSYHIKLYDRQTKNILKTFKGHTNAVTSLVFSPDGKKLYSASSDERIIEWDVASGKMLQDFEKHKSWVTCIDISPDGNYLASGSGDKSVLVWDLHTGKIIHKHKRNDQTIRHVEFNRNRRHLLFVCSGDGEPGRVKIMNLQDGKIVFHYSATAPVCFSPDGYHIFAQAMQGKDIVKINYQIPDSKPVVFRGHTDWSMGVDISPDGQTLVSAGQDDEILAWDVKSGYKLPKYESFVDLTGRIRFTADGRYLVSNHGYNKIINWDLEKVNISWSEKNMGLFDLHPDNKTIFTIHAGKDSAYYKNPKDSLFISYTTDKHYFIKDVAMNQNGNLAAISSSRSVTLYSLNPVKQVDKISLDNNPGEIAFMPGKDILLYEIDNKIYAYDISSQKSNRLLKGEGREILCFDIDEQGIYLGIGDSDKSVRVYNPETGEKICEYALHQSAITDLDFSIDSKFIFSSAYEEDVIQWNIPQNTFVRKLTGNTSNVFNVEVHPSGRLVATGSDDGQILFFDQPTGKQLLALLPLKGYNMEYIAYTPKGYYYSTRRGTEAIHFFFEDKIYFFDQFDYRFNRPDIILEQLGLTSSKRIDMFRKAVEKRYNYADEILQKGQPYHAPDMNIKDMPYFSVSESDTVEFSMQATDTLFGLQSVDILINGIPLYGENGYPVGKAKNKFDSNFWIPLTTGMNKIEVAARNTTGTQSYHHNFLVRCKKKQVQCIHLITLSVSEYRDSTMNLRYAVKDGRDLISAYSKLAGSKLHVDSLYNKDVVIEQIDSLKRKLLSTQPNDLVILFVSGHGLLDENLDFYFATWDTDFHNPAGRGISFTTLSHLLDSIPARKRLFLIDACHSGEVDKESITWIDSQTTETGDITFRSFNKSHGKKIIGLENSFDLMKELFADLRFNNGAQVISSSAGVEYSLEGRKWENGVFTYAFKDLLLDKAVSNEQDDVITVSELKNHLYYRVQELTHGLQTPTMRQENPEYDFVVW